MQSLRELYKIGRGPSSSHTMGPERACIEVKKRFPDADSFEVTLYGSLAMTGKGHLTDVVIVNTLAPLETKVEFVKSYLPGKHPNTMLIKPMKNGKVLDFIYVYSVGGGTIEFEGEEPYISEDVYPHSSYESISEYCLKNGMRLPDYVEKYEGPEIWDYLETIWKQMKRTIADGLTVTGTLAGGLGTKRKANYLYNQRHIDESAQTKENRIVCAYAFSCGEQNASGGLIVTAPTCGACGVVPSVMKYMQDTKGFTDDKIIRALATGGIIGDLIKTNASISGAECGCQAEIGSACSMASASLAELFEMGLDQIEYAAEVAMEHHLGLTCDPIDGLVQIPCIERNAVAAMRAINALSLANFLTDTRKVSFDTVVRTMYETGTDINSKYRETSEGGLATNYAAGKKTSSLKTRS